MTAGLQTLSPSINMEIKGKNYVCLYSFDLRLSGACVRTELFLTLVLIHQTLPRGCSEFMHVSV